MNNTIVVADIIVLLLLFYLWKEIDGSFGEKVFLINMGITEICCLLLHIRFPKLLDEVKTTIYLILVFEFVLCTMILTLYVLTKFQKKYTAHTGKSVVMLVGSWVISIIIGVIHGEFGAKILTFSYVFTIMETEIAMIISITCLVISKKWRNVIGKSNTVVISNTEEELC